MQVYNKMVWFIESAGGNITSKSFVHANLNLRTRRNVDKPIRPKYRFPPKVQPTVTQCESQIQISKGFSFCVQVMGMCSLVIG